MFVAVGFEADIFPLLGAHIGTGAVFSSRRKKLNRRLEVDTDLWETRSTGSFKILMGFYCE